MNNLITNLGMYFCDYCTKQKLYDLSQLLKITSNLHNRAIQRIGSTKGVVFA